MPHPFREGRGWRQTFLPFATVVAERLCFHKRLSFCPWGEGEVYTPWPSRHPLAKQTPPKPDRHPPCGTPPGQVDTPPQPGRHPLWPRRHPLARQTPPTRLTPPLVRQIPSGEANTPQPSKLPGRTAGVHSCFQLNVHIGGSKGSVTSVPIPRSIFFHFHGVVGKKWPK